MRTSVGERRELTGRSRNEEKTGQRALDRQRDNNKNVNETQRASVMATDPRQHMNSGSSNMSREEASGEPALLRHTASS